MPNNDYIKRSDINDAKRKWLEKDDDHRSFAEVIKDIPAADVEPVSHGRWVNDSDHIPHCSECEAIALQRHKLYLEEKAFDVPFVLSKRCPECGAKMDGWEKEEE